MVFPSYRRHFRRHAGYFLLKENIRRKAVLTFGAYVIVAYILFLVSSLKVPTRPIDTIEALPLPSQDTLKDCGFQTYRSPYHHEGLPRLVEVFHTDNSVYFAAMNDGICEPEWRGAQDFSSNHFFVCEYSDGTMVTSDPVPPTYNDVWTTAILIIRCDLPPHLSSLPPLTVSLHATVDLEAGQGEEYSWTYKSSSSLGVYRDIRVCPREWSTESRSSSHHKPFQANQTKNPTRAQPSKAIHPAERRSLSMTTQILMEYETFELEDRVRVRIPPINIFTWLEYNLLIGFEHFYIFDNDPRQHGPLWELLQPYVDEGIVTYIWYPMQDCFRKSDDELDGSRMTISQAMSSTTALRRYSHQTEFMGHFDVDEYIQLPSNVLDIKSLLSQMPSEKLILYHPQKWYHDCKQRRLDTAKEEIHSSVLLDKQLCVSPDTTPGKSIMRTKDILAFFVHAPWVKTDHTLFDWQKEAMEVEGLNIAHVRGRRARDGIPIKVLGEPTYLVSRLETRQMLQAKVDERMRAFHKLRV